MKKNKILSIIFKTLYIIFSGVIIYFIILPMIQAFYHPEPFGYLLMANGFAFVNFGVFLGPFFLIINIWGLNLYKKVKFFFITAIVLISLWIIIATFYFIRLVNFYDTKL